MEIIINDELIIGSNKALPTFVEEYILSPLNVDESIPEYIYKNGRPTLNGRISRILHHNLTYTNSIEICNSLEILLDEILYNSNEHLFSNKPNKKIDLTRELDSWMKSIKK